MRPQEGLGTVPTAHPHVQTEAPGHTYFDFAKKFTMTSALSLVSAGYAMANRTVRGSGFGVLAAYHAEGSVEAGFKDPQAAVTNGINALGTAIWAVGIGTGNSYAQTVGPALNFAAHVASVGLKVCQKEGGWVGKIADAAEMAAFTVAGATGGNRIARGTAFAAAGVAYLIEAPKDPAFMGHAVGMGVWSAGASMQSGMIQSLGAAGVAVAEASRIVVPAFQRFHGNISHEPVSPHSNHGPDLERGEFLPAAGSSEGLPLSLDPSINVAEAAATLSATHPVTSGSPAPHLVGPPPPSWVMSAASMQLTPPSMSTELALPAPPPRSFAVSSGRPARR
ncbi:hypothetical protein ACFWD7_57690 [Streptomyces mirabilis]|uniref:hypothetical protein n=1 Tax=Streptomyces mirabilis TaxID=68239 RepID=UPI0036910F07